MHAITSRLYCFRGTQDSSIFFQEEELENVRQYIPQWKATKK